MYKTLVDSRLHNGICLDLCEELDVSPSHFETHIKRPPDLSVIETKGEANNLVDALIRYAQLLEELL